jgi:phytoene dehydrogenase-like protein
MVLRRLPALRDRAVRPSDAFAGTFHVNEGYAQLQRACAHTLTLFGVHTPARLFRLILPAPRSERSRRRCARSTRCWPSRSRIACGWSGPTGRAWNAHTPVELEAELGLPGGHIFHQDLAWPFAETEDEVGSWGVETAYRNVWICGASARRGGRVSGIPGHNPTQAVLAAFRTR